MRLIGAIILGLFVSCNIQTKSEPDAFCPEKANLLAFTDPYYSSKLYASPLTGKSCEYLENKMTYPDYSYSPNCYYSVATEVLDDDSPQVSTQNTIVPGVLELREIVFNQSYAFYVKNSHVFIYSVTDGEFISSLNLSMEYNSLILKDNILIAKGSSFSGKKDSIKVFDVTDIENIKLLKIWKFDSFVSVKLNNFKLMIKESVYEKLPQEIKCEEILYTSDGLSKSLSIFSVADLKTFEIQKTHVFFGNVASHIDVEDYYFYNSSHSETFIMKDDRYSLVEGVVHKPFGIKEKDNHLMLFLERGRANSFIVLNDDLNYVYEKNGIAPGEDIYAAKFDENKAYLVTFETIDPLFSFDISDVRNPFLIDELKVPGFSRYMHVLEQKRLLTFGKSSGSWDSDVEINLYDTDQKLTKLDSIDLKRVGTLSVFWNHHNLERHGDYIFIRNYRDLFIIKLKDQGLINVGELRFVGNYQIMGKDDELWVFDDQILTRYDLENNLRKIGQDD